MPFGTLYSLPMKYKLEPDNRNCTDEVLLADLRATAEKLGLKSLTQAEYTEHGRFNSGTLKKRFKSWNNALEKGGLKITKRKEIPREELLNDLKRVIAVTGNSELTQTTYRAHGKFSAVTVARTFGSWIKAVAEVGGKVSDNWHQRVTDEDLLKNMADVWERVGRQPKQRDFHPPTSKYSETIYVRRFGSWRAALETFVDFMNGSPQESSILGDSPQGATGASVQKIAERRTSRDPGWRLQFLVYRRDRFSCRVCGRSPALVPGLEMHLDHIVPWSKGGDTTLENLQLLCKRCNIGKGTLAMSAGD